jgi:integrase
MEGFLVSMGKLTVKDVANASSRDKDYRLSDGKGLYLRVRTSGAKSWLYLFRLPGCCRVNEYTLGQASDISLKKAREKLVGLREQVKQGLDPRNERAASIAVNVAAITMQALFEAWIGYVQAAQKVTPLWIKRHQDRWRRHLSKPLGGILVRAINRSHLAGALEAMTRNGTREETRKALTTLNLMLDYGLTRHLVDQNCARMLKPKDFAATANRPRDRVLSLMELRLLWSALDQAVEERPGVAKYVLLSPVTVTAIKLLILTGARRGEVAEMRWSELDLKAGTWTLSKARTKNRQAHTIHLSDLAIQLLTDLKFLTGSSSFVFDTGRSNGKGHINQDSMNRALARLKSKEPLASIPTFTVHDLRRSAATAWGEYLKTLPHVIERMLNHQPVNKLIATYQRAVYADEQKDAWLAWGLLVQHQVAKDSGNVVPFSSNRKAV